MVDVTTLKHGMYRFGNVRQISSEDIRKVDLVYVSYLITVNNIQNVLNFL